ncbi:hypothetical protein ACFSUS_18890 [Spirosoma soli]|uniref:Glycosyltransferase RgtA/B/C/D-like domain-containing protein n=1 Tax=Spirosoma soli TaxID=1770529 RepID=A0ABW5M8J2_9BACT
MYPWLYYVVSIGLLAILVRQCQATELDKRTANPTRSDAVFLVVALALLVFMRVPSAFYNRELNPDESQLITQAITLTQDPVYGRSVDGTSIGPINSYLLLIPHVFGLPLDYTAARLTGLLLIGLSIVSFYFSLLRIATPVVSRLCLLIVLLFFSWATHSDFLHYSSELSSLVLITACFGLVAGLLRSSQYSLSRLVGLGAIAGLAPYCKLQTLPVIGMMLITLALYLIISQRHQAWRPLLGLSVGFGLPTVVVFALAYWFGVERYFIDYYFIGNLTTYAQIYAHVPLVSQGFMAKLFRFPAFLLEYTDFLIFIVFNSLTVVAAAVVVWRKYQQLTPALSWSIILVILTVTGALWAVITPGTEFGHHLLLLVFPLGWVVAIALQFVITHVPRRLVTARLAMLTVTLFGLELLAADNLVLPFAKRLIKGPSHKEVAALNQTSSVSDLDAWLLERNPCLFAFPDKKTVVMSPVARAISRYAQPSDKMAVWGWNCQYYVEAQLAQGVSENHTQRSIIPNKMRKQYIDRYAHELIDNQPALFVDAVGDASWMLTKPSQQHEHFTEIDRVIRQNYSLATSVDNVRIYVRRDRLSSRETVFTDRPRNRL